MRLQHILVMLAVAGFGPGCEGPEGPKGADGLDGDSGVDGVDGEDGQDGQALVAIETDTRWDEDTMVAGILVVRAGATLTVAAGVEVSIAPESGMYIAGAFVSEGTAEAPVRVVSTENLRKSFNIAGDSAGSELSYVDFNLVNVRLEGDAVTVIDHCTFSHGEVVAWNRKEDLVVRNSAFSADPLWHLYNFTARDVAGDVTIENSTFEGGYYAVSWEWSSPDATMNISGSSFTDHNSAIRMGSVSQDPTPTLSIATSTISNTYRYGLYVVGGNLSLTDTTLSDMGDSGVRAVAGSMVSLSGVDILNSSGSCIYTLGDASVVDSHLSGCYRGLYASGAVTMSNSIVELSEYDGVYAQALTLSDSTIRNNGSAGVHVTGADVSTVANSVVDGNGSYGIRGPTSGTNLLDVVGNNLTSNVRESVYEVRLLSGNYVADNNGATGADTESGGTLDGIRGTDTAQVQDADQIENPLAEPISGAGATE